VSLRWILSVLIGSLLVLTLSAVIVLDRITDYHSQATRELTSALNSVEQAEELEVKLLTYALSTNPTEKASIAAELQHTLQSFSQFVNSSEEAALLRQAQRSMNAYLSQREDRSENPEGAVGLDEANRAINQLVHTNMEQAHEAERNVAQWDHIVEILGSVVPPVLLVGTLILLLWLWKSAFQPVLQILAAMKSVAAGETRTLVPETGPKELRQIAAEFNRMVDAIADQRGREMAFLAGVAHDLRNPISALKAASDLIAMEQLPDSRLRSVTSVINRQAGRLDRMVGDLLDASRIRAGHLELRWGVHDARDLVREVHDLFQAASPSHPLRIGVPDQVVPVRCDSLRLEQVLTNLVSNAIKYSPEGGDIRIDVQAAQHEAVFRVSDRGCGIPPEDLPYIFEPFRRSRRLGDSVPGAGLGLSVSRRIIEAHRGRIHVESQPGSGTSFFVHIPLSN
jgi:two-component system sensor histidine kinase MtrB